MRAAAVMAVEAVVTVWHFISHTSNVFKSPFMTVDESMVRAAKQDQIVDIGRAVSFGPGDNMVCVAP